MKRAFLLLALALAAIFLAAPLLAHAAGKPDASDPLDALQGLDGMLDNFFFFEIEMLLVSSLSQFRKNKKKRNDDRRKTTLVLSVLVSLLPFSTRSMQGTYFDDQE